MPANAANCMWPPLGELVKALKFDDSLANAKGRRTLTKKKKPH